MSAKTDRSGAVWTWERPEFYRKQEAALFSPAKRVAIEGSTKSGKTVAAQAWLIEQALRGPVGRYSWFAPIFATARDVGFRLAVKGLQDTGLIVRDAISESPMRIDLINGSWLAYHSADNLDSLFGGDSEAVMVDESSRCPDGTLAAAESVLTATDGALRLIGNCKGGTWFRELCEEIENGERPDWEFRELNWRDAVAAGVVRQETVDRARRTLTRAEFGELYDNRAQRNKSNPFERECLDACVTDEHCGGSDEPEIDWQSATGRKPVCWGWDLALTEDDGDWTVGIGLDKYRQVCRVVRFRERAPTVERRIEALTEELPARVDGTGLGAPICQRFEDRGLYNLEAYVFTEKTKQQAVHRLAMPIQRGETKYPRGFLHDELCAFRVEFRGNHRVWTAPPGKHDDGVCAYALAQIAFEDDVNLHSVGVEIW